MWRQGNQNQGCRYTPVCIDISLFNVWYLFSLVLNYDLYIAYYWQLWTCWVDFCHDWRINSIFWGKMSYWTVFPIICAIWFWLIFKMCYCDICHSNTFWKLTKIKLLIIILYYVTILWNRTVLWLLCSKIYTVILCINLLAESQQQLLRKTPFVTALIQLRQH